MWNIIHLDLDLKKKNYSFAEVNQADDVCLNVKFYNNGQPLDLVDGEDTLIVNYANANGTVTGDSSISKTMRKSGAMIYLPRNCTNSAGTAHMQVTINTNKTYVFNKQTTSFPIDIKIHQSVVDGKAVSTNINSMIDDINKATIEGNKVINNIKDTAVKHPTSSQLYADVERLKSREYKTLSSTDDILLQSEGLYKGINVINAPNQESIIYYYDVKAWGDNYKRIDSYRCTLDETYTNFYKSGTWTGWVNNRDRIKLISSNDILLQSEGKYQGVCKNSPVLNSDYYYDVIAYRDNSKYKKVIAYSIYDHTIFENTMNYGTWSGWVNKSNLSSYSQDSTHRLVSDSEKNKWNMITGSGALQQSSYCKLPNGLIMQWGCTNLAIESKQSTSNTAVFPVEFPNKLLNIQANVNRNISTKDKTGCENIIVNAIMSSGVSTDKKQITIFGKDVIGSGSNWTFEIGWFAIGY